MRPSLPVDGVFISATALYLSVSFLKTSSAAEILEFSTEAG